jgi:hypothetical protein
VTISRTSFRAETRVRYNNVAPEYCTYRKCPGHGCFTVSRIMRTTTCGFFMAFSQGFEDVKAGTSEFQKKSIFDTWKTRLLVVPPTKMSWKTIFASFSLAPGHKRCFKARQNSPIAHSRTKSEWPGHSRDKSYDAPSGFETSLQRH